MTPNGAAIFAVITIAAAAAADLRGLATLCLIAAAFAATELRGAAVPALRRATLLMLPLAAFMIVIWVGIVGRAPAEIAAGLPGSRLSALTYVATISLRLFVVIFMIQAAMACFRDESPFSVIRALTLPLPAKRLLVLTLSLIETLRHSVDRSHTALVSSGVITRRLSLRNLLHGWILIQSVWLTAITTVMGRVRDKWPAENTLGLLDPALQGTPRPLSSGDTIWSAVALAGLIFAMIERFNGTA
jgi:hypothetical protein